MLYHVSRNGQTYGPYTLEDLQKYVASGNILPTDLARSESMSEWLPVAQILGGATSALAQPPVPPSGYAPYPAAAAGVYPDPPNLHWALVLLIGIFTCGIFIIVWDIIQAVWMRKVVPQSKALFYYIAEIVISFVGNMVRVMIFAVAGGLHGAYGGGYNPYASATGLGFAVSGLVVGLAALVLVILARFDMKAAMEQHYNTAEPIGLQLGPVMTFFFGSLYFQYHFSRINEMKRMARYGAPTLR